MENIKGLKHYWIFLVTLIFYTLGIVVHFIAQSKGPHPHHGREILEKVSPRINTINNSKNKNTTSANTGPSKYATPDNLFYFVQVSDIHMGESHTSGTQGHFLYFTEKILPIINPNFLFITGDITDSISKDLKIGTVKEDWVMYRKIIDHTNIPTKNNGTFLWDMRGNHDCFMIPEWNSKYNYFKDYSHTKTRGFSFNYETSYGTYSFVGLDGCPVVSTSNPFFGIIDEVSMDMYTNFMDKAKANPKNKHNFVFNHFPETTAKFAKTTSGKRWTDYTKDISLMLTGHFHSLGGNYLYAYHRNFLELELSDFRMHGRYRIVSVDNDIVSITDNILPLPKVPYDFKTSEVDKLIENPPEVFNKDIPPIVHITLPKNSRFNLKRGEPIQESYSSEYVRVLVFSDFPPKTLKLSLYIDDKLQNNVEFQYVGNKKLTKRDNTIHVNTRDDQNQNVNEHYTVNYKTPPLWIAKWNNTIYNDGKSHSLKVIAIDSNNMKGETSIKFRLDGKDDSLGVSFISTLLLKSVFPRTLPVFFGIVYIVYELMIILSRWYSVKYIIPNHPDLPFLPFRYIGDMIFNETEKFRNGGYFKRHFVGPFIEAFTFNGVFYPIQILLICVLVFPGRIGIMSRSSEDVSRVGGEFLYGTYTSGQWSNLFDQYGMYIINFLLLVYVDTFILVSMNHKNWFVNAFKIVMLSFLFLFQMVYTIALAYICGGIMAIFIAPFPNWFCIYCWIIILIIIIRRRVDGSSKPVTPEIAPVQV